MATKSFTREIRITEPSAIKKIDDAMKMNSTDKYKTTINNVDELKSASRKSLSSRITNKY